MPSSVLLKYNTSSLKKTTDNFSLSFRGHALLELKNVIITPHIGSATSQARRHMMERMVESILAAVNGLPVTNEVHE